MAHVVRKDPDAAKKFEIDWSPVIGAATITASSWTVPTGVTQTAASYAGKISDITISGGTLREVYELENSITDSTSSQHSASMFVLIEDQLAETVESDQVVSLTDAKTYLRVSHDDEDTRIRDLIDAATRYIETRIDRDLLTKCHQMILCGFPAEFEIPRPPTQAVLRIEYYDENNVLRTLPSSQWYAYQDGEYTRVINEVDTTWPSTASRPDAVILTYESGYGDSQDDVPRRAKQAILMLARHWYDNPTAVVTGTIATDVPLTVASLVRSLNPGTYL